MRRPRRVLATVLVGLLVGLLTTILLVVPAGAAYVSGGKAPSDQPTYSYDSPSASTTSPTDPLVVALRGERIDPTTSRPSTSVFSSRRAAKGGEEAFHYTSREALDSIQAEGLRRGSYATRNGDLSPLQAQIDLALPPNRGLRDAVVRVDLAGLRRAGYEVPEFNRVGRKFNMPGGAYEVQFDYPIPPQFLKVVRP